jgi:hypothetical protein
MRTKKRASIDDMIDERDRELALQTGYEQT